MTGHKLLSDMFGGALVIMIITLLTGLGTGFTVAQVLSPMRRATP